MNIEHGNWRRDRDHREIGIVLSSERGYMWLEIDMWLWWFIITLKEGHDGDYAQYN